ncbi:helix-hairpin-helix domain-containing protein [Myxococcota bacterium]|nr:helix-hairpin-helix domain-containing protein [Myxococcota bacterium]
MSSDPSIHLDLSLAEEDGMSFSGLDFSEGDLNSLLSGLGTDDAEPFEGELEASDELHALARTLSGQYVDVVGAFVRQVFSSRPGRAQPGNQVLGALDALLRLSKETGDVPLQSALSTVHEVITAGVPEHRRDFNRFLTQLRDAVLVFADLLREEDAERLKGLILYQDRSLPLLEELANLRGIGPKRLERLYCAGLFTIEAVAEADPGDVAEVTGLPRKLAEQVVESTREFAERQRRSCVVELHQRVQEFHAVLPRLNPSNEDDRRILELARQTLAELQSALSQIEQATTR